MLANMLTPIFEARWTKAFMFWRPRTSVDKQRMQPSSLMASRVAAALRPRRGEQAPVEQRMGRDWDVPCRDREQVPYQTAWPVQGRCQRRNLKPLPTLPSNCEAIR